MRWILFTAALLAGLAGNAWVAAREANASTYVQPGAVVSVSYFYDALSPYGMWVNYSPYGWCWTPNDVSFGWRPYSDGSWAYTDYGWTWVDYEPWGWAPYHYGRWFYDAQYGWLWVPGRDWAPAWVAWCGNDDWVGWTPLPPVVGWNATYGVSYASFDVRDVPASNWCFVQQRDLTSTNLGSRILPAARNVSILPDTRSVTRFAVRNGRPVDVGIDVRTIERASGRDIRPLRVVDASADRPGQARRSGGQIEMFRKPLAPAQASAAPRPDARRQFESPPQTDRGQGNPGRGNENGRGRKRFDAQVEREQERLDSQHRNDTSAAVRGGASRQAVAQRHAAEQQAFAQQAARERAQYERRVSARSATPQAAPGGSRGGDPGARQDDDHRKGKDRRGRELPY